MLARRVAAAARFTGVGLTRGVRADSMEMGLSYDAAEADPNMMRMEASAQARARCGCLVDAWRGRARADVGWACRCATSCASTRRGATRARARWRARRTSAPARPPAPRCVRNAQRACRQQLSSRFASLRPSQVGERSFKPTSASQYSMQDLDVSNDTDDSFGGASLFAEGSLCAVLLRAACLAQPSPSVCSACWRWASLAALCSSSWA